MYLRLKSQADEEGLKVTNNMLLTAALTAKNALTNVGGVSPMQAALGHQPAILPDSTQMAAIQDDNNALTGSGIARHSQRIRELAVEAMVNVSAKERLERAMRTKTRKAVQHEQYERGDEVEFFRPQSQKEVPGWRGPATIMDVEADGTIHLKWQGGTLICRPQDVRRALTYITICIYIGFEAGRNDIITP